MDDQKEKFRTSAATLVAKESDPWVVEHLPKNELLDRNKQQAQQKSTVLDDGDSPPENVAIPSLGAWLSSVIPANEETFFDLPCVYGQGTFP